MSIVVVVVVFFFWYLFFGDLHQSKLWNINNVYFELLYVNFLFQSDSSERLWKITGIVFGFLNFRLQHLWTFPRNGSGLWLLDFHRLHQRILSHKWHVLAFSKFVVSSPVVTILMDMVDISYTFPKMNDKLFCQILTFSPFVSHDWLHIKLLFRSLACKEEAMSWRPVFLIFICKTLFWFFFLKFQSPLWKIRNQHNRQIELASCGSCFLISRFHHQAWGPWLAHVLGRFRCVRTLPQLFRRNSDISCRSELDHFDLKFEMKEVWSCVW